MWNCKLNICLHTSVTWYTYVICVFTIICLNPPGPSPNIQCLQCWVICLWRNSCNATPVESSVGTVPVSSWNRSLTELVFLNTNTYTSGTERDNRDKLIVSVCPLVGHLFQDYLTVPLLKQQAACLGTGSSPTSNLKTFSQLYPLLFEGAFCLKMRTER